MYEHKCAAAMSFWIPVPILLCHPMEPSVEDISFSARFSLNKIKNKILPYRHAFHLTRKRFVRAYDDDMYVSLLIYGLEKVFPVTDRWRNRCRETF